jgi:D-alanine-D-alanine ligase
MKIVAVFFGGVSVEHDVSVITGVMTVNATDKTKYQAEPIFVDKNGEWYTGELLKDVDEYKDLDYKKLKKVMLKPGDNRLYQLKAKKLKPLFPIAVAINCMHGERGEDGSLAGILKTCNIPLASPDITASSVCMDKCVTKTAMKGLKVKTLPGVTVTDSDSAVGLVKGMRYPLIVKPACLGSSIGISQAKNAEELQNAVNYALKFGEKAIIEPCLKNFIEINCAVYRKANGSLCISECERPVSSTSFLSFDDRYSEKLE